MILAKASAVCVLDGAIQNVSNYLGGDVNGEFLAGAWFGLEPLCTIRGTVRVVRSNYCVKRFCIALSWPYHRIYRNEFDINNMVPGADMEKTLCSKNYSYKTKDC